MNWNCLIWSMIAMFSGIINTLILTGVAEPLDTTEITMMLTSLCMVFGIIYAIDAAKEDDEDGNQGES